MLASKFKESMNSPFSFYLPLLSIEIFINIFYLLVINY